MTTAVRDKGRVPLDRADGKPFGGVEPATGFLWIGFLDLQHHEAVVWYEPLGWLPRVSYEWVNLTNWIGFIHDGHFKVEGYTWLENGGTVPGGHFIVLDLGPVPKVN